MDEVVSGDFCTAAAAAAAATRVGPKCGRWNPTADQVKVLTDLFSSGLRTPTTEQIQKISSLLGAFGKIESKNVFYWFQNHKARERHHKKRPRGDTTAADDDDVHVVTAGDNISDGPPVAVSKTVPNFACFRSGARSCREVELQEVVWERRDREIETLELFPLSTYGGEKVRTVVRNGGREISSADDIAGREPPLDLRLSFL